MDRRWVVLGNPENRRTTLFQEALAERGLPPAAVLSWLDLLTGRIDLREKLNPGDVIRIDSPGRDFAVERELLALGASEAEAEAAQEGGAFLEAEACRRLEFDKGRLLVPRQWYLGFRRALYDLIRPACQEAREPILCNSLEEIALLFDKPECQTRIGESGVSIPYSLGLISSWDHLLARMQESGTRRVFLKLAHGSSAIGTIAYRVDETGERHQAMTTVDAEVVGNQIRLYNTRSVQELDDPRDIAFLVNRLAPHRLAAEVWLPKASLPGKGAFDVRALVIAGRLRQVIGRCSRSPMTNLHLLNQRASSEEVRAQVGETGWQLLEEAALRAAAVFPNSLQVGLDILFLPGCRRLAVVEANAFGDLLPEVLSEGESSYRAEIRAVQEGWHPVEPRGSLVC